MDMMKRIKEEITTDATADQWENKLEEFGVVFSHDEIPEGRTLPLSPMGAFLLCKNCLSRVHHVEFFSVALLWSSLYKSVTTEVVTLRDNSNDYFATRWDGSATPV